MKTKMFWEGREYHVFIKPKGFTPIELCEGLGKDGRRDILSVLTVNHREEVLDLLDRVEHFEKANFKPKKDGTGKFYASNNPERYYVGPCETREEAIEEFKNENDGEEPAHVGIGNEVSCSIDGYRAMELWSEGEGTELYEDALDGWCAFRPNDPRWDVLGDRLTKVFHEWLDEVGEQKSWTMIEEC